MSTLNRTTQRELNNLLEDKARIEKRIAKIQDPKKRPKLPKNLLKAARKQYKELRAEKHQINIQGIWFTVDFYWEGYYGDHFGFAESCTITNWKIDRRKRDTGYNKLARILEDACYSYDDDEILSMIARSRKFTNYENKVYQFVEKIIAYEEKYDFSSVEVA